MEQPDSESNRTREQGDPNQLLLWPGIAAVVLQWIIRFGVPAVIPGSEAFAMVGGIVLWLAVVIWWVFFSRAPRNERWGGGALMVVALLLTPLILHESIATGMMRLTFPIYATPVLSLAFVIWAAIGRRLSPGPRWAALVAVILLSCGVWALLRTEGITGAGSSQFAWRWAPTAEERLIAQTSEEAPPPVPQPTPEPAEQPEQQAAPQSAEEAKPEPAPIEAEAQSVWPAFRGAARDSIVADVRIETDWEASPPVELWRRAVGPGWSSFAVQGNLIYTQEQRGEDEFVTCYHATTGEPVWRHSDEARFWESNAGAGPRGTPTLSDGRVYTFGGTGILNALDAATGAVLWSRNTLPDTGAEVPTWGFSSSPLVVGDLVVIHSGVLAAYDPETGDLRWKGPDRGGSYSSPHLATIDGVEQILMLSDAGATSVAPADGAVLWEYDSKGTPIVQPALTADGDVLISGGDGNGTRRLAVSKTAEGWSVEERWNSNRLKPYFNDFVIHKGHAYGFDGRILTCVDLETGQRVWKGGRFGYGQMILLSDQELLLVTSEEGEIGLVSAVTSGFTGLARIPAIEGKTWNHPVLADDLLLIRNGEEMAAFRLTAAP